MNSKKHNKKKTQKYLVMFSRIMASIVIIAVILVLMPLTLPRLLGYQTYNVVSGSMEPEIPVGSLLFVERIDPYEVKEDDVITFYSNATVVSHRVVRNNTIEGKFTTKGDANENVDMNDVRYNDLIGIMRYHLPLMGAVGAYISTWTGKLLIGIMIICAILLYAVSARI